MKATFEWDDENRSHIARHDITPLDVEVVVQDVRSSHDLSRSSGRPIVFGRTKTGRYLMVAYEVIKERPWTIRVITAYDVRPP